MSYKLGFEAFVKRFQKRFPTDNFQWEYKEPETKYTDGLWIAHNDACTLFLHFTNRNYHQYRVKHNGEVVCTISCDFDFGISLCVRSFYLDSHTSFLLYRRPLRLCHGTKHNRRQWLKNKPKFGQLGCYLSKQLMDNFEKVHGKTT